MLKLSNKEETLRRTLKVFTKGEIVRALEVWVREVALSIYEVTEPKIADIHIKFVER